MTCTFLGRCQRLRQCGFPSNCVCDVDPTDPKDVVRPQSDIEAEIASAYEELDARLCAIVGQGWEKYRAGSV